MNNGYEIPAKVIKIVCSHVGLEVEEISTTRRCRELVNARYMAMYFIKQYTRLSLAEIGHYFPHGDHATILHGIRKVGDEAGIYPAFRQELHVIDLKIKDMIDYEFKRYENYDTDTI